MPLRNRILIVDDSPRNVAILKKIFGKHYAVESAASGEEALEVASRMRPDLILLDIMMPGIDGYETCRRLREDPLLRWVRVIMVSAKAMVGERLQGYAAGADDYVTKPFDDVEIEAKVQVHLRLKCVEEVNQLKTDFLSLLCHETRTPLQSVIGAAELMSRAEDMDDGERQKWIDVILDGGRSLQKLLGKVFVLGQLKTGDIVFHFEPVDVAELVEQATSALADAASAAGVFLEIRRENPVIVLADPGWVLSVITALLENAIRASPAGGTVWLSTDRSLHGGRFTVADRGVGIDPAFLRRVFDSFTTPDATHHADGHGLSLAIAREIVLAHGGTITAESTKEDGTRFTVDLVAAPEVGASSSAHVAPEAPPIH